MAPTAPERTLAMGTELQGGKFTVGRVLGEGGFGLTYKGAHRSLQRAVAIKELFPVGAVRLGTSVSMPQSRQADFKREMDSILQEARIIASLRSTAIVDVHDMFRENGTAYIIMEYLEGETLQDAIASRGSLPGDRVLAIALATCDALAEVHSRQLLHRDVKPANVMLTRDGRTVLIDFGSAREFQVSQTAHHTRILTEEYAAPEQYSTQARFGPYTDVFGLGATLFHALTGDPPPRALDRLQHIAPPLAFPDEVENTMQTALQQALQLKVQDRPQTITAFRGLLLAKGSAPPLDSTPVPASVSTPPAQTHNAYSTSSDGGHPYFFKGKPFHTPTELAAALAQDWDAAISDWRRGYIRTWMTRNATGSDFERAVDSMLEDPFFRGPDAKPPPAHATIRLGGDTSEIAVLERQLLRVIAAMDPAWPPSYRGMPLQDKFALQKWLGASPRQSPMQKWLGASPDSRKLGDRKLVDRCIQHQILLAHPKKFGRQLHRDLQQQARVCHQQLAKRNLLAPSLVGFNGDNFRLWWDSGSSRRYKLQILCLLVDAETTGPIRERMEQDKKAMRIRWFRELVDAAAHSFGCAAALETLQPKARSLQNRNNVLTAVFLVFFFFFILLPGLAALAS